MSFRHFYARLLIALALLTASLPSEAAWQFRVQNGSPGGGGGDGGSSQVFTVQPGAGWNAATNDSTYTARASKGFTADPLPADPSSTIQSAQGLPVNFERAIANWSDPDGEIITQEDATLGVAGASAKFRMGIEAYHQYGINHIDVMVEGNGTGSDGSKITIPGSALTNLVRTDPVTGKTYTNSNFYVFDLALASSTTIGGKIQMVADVYPNVGFPVRLGKNGSYALTPANFTPQTLFFDPNNRVTWTTYYLAPATGGTTSPSVVGNDNNNGITPTTPWASFNKLRNSVTSTAPAKVLVYDGSYLADHPGGGGNGNPVPVWIRFKETRLGASFGRATFTLTDTVRTNNTDFSPNSNIQWDGITYNPANSNKYFVGSNTVIFKRSSLAADYGTNANGVNRNGPGQASTDGGPRVDEQYGIYWPNGFGHSAVGFDKPLSNDFYFAGGNPSILETDVNMVWCTGQTLIRNSTVSCDYDLVGLNTNTHAFGNVMTTGRTDIPGIFRLTKEQVILADQVTYDQPSNKTTVTFQNTQAGAQPVTGTDALSGQAWIVDQNSKYYSDKVSFASYHSLNASWYSTGVKQGSYPQLTMVLNGDYRDGISTGTPIVGGGYAHNDWLQSQELTPDFSTTASTLKALSHNMIVSGNTFLGRPSSMVTHSIGKVQNNPTTLTYDANGNLSSTKLNSYLVIDSDGRNFHTTDGAGAPRPVTWMTAYYGINIPRIAASPVAQAGGSGSILVYNNTNAPLTDPLYGTFNPGYGMFAEVVTNPDGTPRAYGGTAGATYLGWVGNVNWIEVNNFFVLSRRELDNNVGWNYTGEQRNHLFVGNTFFGGGVGYDNSTNTAAVGFVAPGALLQDNIMKSTLPAVPDFTFQGNSFGSLNTGGGPNNYPVSNIVEPTMTLPDQSAWADQMVPPLLTGVNAKATSTTIRKFDRYGLPIVPGVSLVGARAQ